MLECKPSAVVSRDVITAGSHGEVEASQRAVARRQPAAEDPGAVRRDAAQPQEGLSVASPLQARISGGRPQGQDQAQDPQWTRDSAGNSWLKSSFLKQASSMSRSASPEVGEGRLLDQIGSSSLPARKA